MQEEQETKQTNKHARRPIKKILIIGTLSVLLLFTTTYLARGWIRNSLLPAYYLKKHSSSLVHAVHDSYDVISEPLGLQRGKNQKPQCDMTAAKSVHTQIYCWTSISFFENNPAESTESIGNNLAILQSALEDEGWSHAGGLTDWAAQIAENTDSFQNYYDGGDLIKNFGDTVCAIVLYHEHGFRGNIQCIDDVYFMGRP